VSRTSKVTTTILQSNTTFCHPYRTIGDTMGGANVQDYPIQYFTASALAATGCYPLWRSAAIGQSGFRVAATIGGLAVPPSIAPYVYGFLPPYKGMMATVLGMTYAKATIFSAPIMEENFSYRRAFPCRLRRSPHLSSWGRWSRLLISPLSERR